MISDTKPGIKVHVEPPILCNVTVMEEGTGETR
jgi:hypothetical protein